MGRMGQVSKSPGTIFWYDVYFLSESNIILNNRIFLKTHSTWQNLQIISQNWHLRFSHCFNFTKMHMKITVCTHFLSDLQNLMSALLYFLSGYCFLSNTSCTHEFYSFIYIYTLPFLKVSFLTYYFTYFSQ